MCSGKIDINWLFNEAKSDCWMMLFTGTEDHVSIGIGDVDSVLSGRTQESGGSCTGVGGSGRLHTVTVHMEQDRSSQGSTKALAGSLLNYEPKWIFNSRWRFLSSIRQQKMSLWEELPFEFGKVFFIVRPRSHHRVWQGRINVDKLHDDDLHLWRSFVIIGQLTKF